MLKICIFYRDRIMLMRNTLEHGVSALEHFINLIFACLPQKKPNAKLSKKVKLIAHRGAYDHSKNIIENTTAAFEHALKLKCYGVEFDVRSTADNVLVIHHDPTLERLWN